MNFEGGYSYPQDQEFQLENSFLPGSGTAIQDKSLLTGSQQVLVDRYGNPLVGTNWQLGDFLTQLTQGVPNDNSAYQSHNAVPQVGHTEYAQPIENGSAIPLYQLNHALYGQEIHNASTSRNANLVTSLYPDITAPTEYPNTTPGTNNGAPNGVLMPSFQSFVDNKGQSVPISSLLDILSQPLDLTIFGNTNNFNQMQHSAKTEMAFTPANDRQGNHSNESGAFHVLNQHDYNLNQPSRTDNITCTADSDANVPVTLNKLENFQLSMSKSTIEEQNYLKSTEKEAIQHGCGVLQNVLDSSTVASTLSEKTIDLGKISDQGIDLNKTPQQKPTRRRKHRPKVIREGKPKRNIGTTPKKTATSDEKPSGKRKYVRRNGLTEADQKAGARRKTVDSNSGRARRSCKRTLDLELDLDLDKDKSKDEKPEDLVCQHVMQQTNRTFDVNSSSEVTGSYSRFESLDKMESKTNISQQNGFKEVNEQENACIYPAPSTPFKERVQNENTFLENRQTAASFIAIDTGRNDPYTRTHQPELEKTGRTVFQVTTPTPNYVIQYSINPSEAIGLGYNRAVEQPLQAPTDVISQEVLQEAECSRRGCSTSTAPEDSHKKRKTGNTTLIKMPAPDSSLLQIEDNTVQTGINKEWSPTDQTIQPVSKSYSTSSYPQRLNNGVGRYSDNEALYLQMAARSSFSRKHNLSPSESYMERVGETKKPAQVNSSTPQIEVDKGKLTPPTPVKTTGAVKGKTSKSRPVKRSAKSKKAEITPFTSKALDANRALQEQGSPTDSLHSFEKTKGETEVDGYSYIDEVIRLLNSLNIRENSDQDKKALVPYGGSGAIVPLDIKKKKPRPKVDLDTETIRVWNMLMGIEGSTGPDPMQKGSESWWENERNVFRGRAESFIARMRIVQGDRHFSRWKGSVVDSVVGVYLTQNVSDHLSSSAFMTLAAEFPLKLRSSSSTVNPQDNVEILVEEPEKCVPDPSEPVSHEKAPYTIGKATPYEEHYNCITGSLLFDQRSNHGHVKTDDFEHEQQTAFLHTGNSDNMLEHSPAMHVENYQLNTTDNGLLQGFGEESSSSWSSTISGLSHAKDAACTSSMIGQTGSLNSCTVPNQGLPVSREKSPSSRNALTENPSLHQQSTSTQKSKTVSCQQSDINSQLESTTEMKQVNPANVLEDRETSTIQHIPNTSKLIEDAFEFEKSNLTAEEQIKLDNIVDAPISKDQALPSATASKGENNSINKRKKGKAGGDVKPDENWESLRKKVQAESPNKQRSYDAMDSMDYEAIRHASVNYISGVIKERGMNNRLAERMKEFLNRLVRVHGSIDLEWLRDAPPDEAKDYLLSIWGIGLKSVECVRLLTLHHLAFPVDTNVGRIAVRLGWVPLQPLPESLQLHLLELYPILETIQKYLWPRLCKLDQQKLYELHYHLITFGKVFCTKHKPNCNACPMRGECRHFASAFASARLSLPGPEDEGEASVNTVPQLTAKSTCEPIVEQPKSPEPESREVLEYDIEDTFWEDSDEIPTFRLNMQEFTDNMQNYVQTNMDLHESDMSKALVALTSGSASIPAPKLKNVNRLRTEHLVYELPDFHPLLEGMDRREPDDPSPYLLALWTPGETANTVEPPESTCHSQETGKLCNENTCFTCNSRRESDSQTVRGTLLIPCRTAMRGRFPLNGTYFQVNEVFADDKSSKDPIAVPRRWLWNLPRRTVYFGSSVTSIFRGLTTAQIQLNFWRGFVCVRGFHQETRAPRPLVARLHCSLAKLALEKKRKQNMSQ